MGVIKNYDINIKYLPRPVLTQSVIAVIGAILILGAILLLLPIQDTIKGEVIIYGSGQPINIQSRKSGIIHQKVNDGDIMAKGGLIATIDVEVTQPELDALRDFVKGKLTQINWNATPSLSGDIQNLVGSDFRELNNELYTLSDIIQQLATLQSASNPKDLVATLDRSITAKNKQVQQYSQLNDNQNDIILFLLEQLKSDSLLYSEGGISEREYLQRQRSIMDRKSMLIENDVESQVAKNEIIQVEREKEEINQNYRSRTEELKLKIIDQVGVIRRAYQEYLDDYIIIAPIDGKVALLPQIRDQSHVNENTVILYMTPRGAAATPTSELYVTAKNAGKVEPGMKVRIGLSEFDQKEYGIYYTHVISISDILQDGRYKIDLKLDLPITTSYNLTIPSRHSYNGQGEVLLGKINLLTKISREISFNRDKFASL